MTLTNIDDVPALVEETKMFFKGSDPILVIYDL